MYTFAFHLLNDLLKMISGSNFQLNLYEPPAANSLSLVIFLCLFL